MDTMNLNVEREEESDKQISNIQTDSHIYT